MLLKLWPCVPVRTLAREGTALGTSVLGIGGTGFGEHRSDYSNCRKQPHAWGRDKGKLSGDRNPDTPRRAPQDWTQTLRKGRCLAVADIGELEGCPRGCPEAGSGVARRSRGCSSGRAGLTRCCCSVNRSREQAQPPARASPTLQCPLAGPAWQRGVPGGPWHRNRKQLWVWSSETVA